MSAHTEVSAPRQFVWDWITDPAHALHYMGGVTQFDVLGEQQRGLGTRYRLHMRVGSAEVGATVEVVEYHEPADLAWSSVLGLDHRQRFRLRELPHGRTSVELRLSYGIAGGGVGGWLAERLAARTVRDNLRRTVAQLKRQVEQEQLREIASRRRPAGVTQKPVG